MHTEILMQLNDVQQSLVVHIDLFLEADFCVCFVVNEVQTSIENIDKTTSPKMKQLKTGVFAFTKTLHKKV